MTTDLSPTRPSRYEHRGPVAAGTVLLFALTLAALALHGARGRVFLSGPKTVTVTAADDAYRAWKQAGVRGRVLLLFDRYPHFQLEYARYQAGAPLNEGDFLDFAVFENVVRKLWIVVREEEWEAIARQPALYRPLWRFPGVPAALSLHQPGGLPLVAATPASLPRFSEEVLVYVNRALFDPGQVAALLSARGIRSDLVVVYAGEVPR